MLGILSSVWDLWIAAELKIWIVWGLNLPELHLLVYCITKGDFAIGIEFFIFFYGLAA